MQTEKANIWTNMRFWQSPLWLGAAQSIYPSGLFNDGESMPVWRQAWLLLQHRGEADAIITMGVRESMAYAFLCAILGRPAKQVMVEIFLDSPRPRNLAWRMKNAIYGFLIRRSRGVIVNSSFECEAMAGRFGLDAKRIRFLPLCSTLTPQATTEAEPPYVFSAGRTLRDFGLLRKVAEQAPELLFRIVCGSSDLADAPLPSNLTVLREVDHEVYLRELRQSALVVIPLLPTQRSTGQVVLLEAMAMGKPVIASRSPGMIDYVQDQKTGILVDVGDLDQMRSTCLRLMADPAERCRLGQGAINYVSEFGTADQYARQLLDIVSDWQNIGR